MKIDKAYIQWIKQLKEKVRSTQIKAAIAVNSELIKLYWELGAMISKKENIWGSKLIEQVANDLKDEFPDIKGLSRSNLYYCKKFYLFYSEYVQQAVGRLQERKDKPEKIQQDVGQFQGADKEGISKVKHVVAQIPWGHNILIFTKCNDVRTALFYVQKTKENQWSRSTLKDQLKSELHKREGKAISNFKNTLPNPLSELAQETLKDPYVFDFLQLDTTYREKDIENQLIHHVNRFLLELGKGFAFVGQQYPLKISDNAYFLDLLFYHTRLKCYVVIELKNTRFRPEFTGKLNFYLSAVDSLVKADDDNPTIGLLLCKERDNIEAEFALRDLQKPIGISEYILTKELPDDLKSNLPTIEEIENQLTFKTDEEE